MHNTFEYPYFHRHSHCTGLVRRSITRSKSRPTMLPRSTLAFLGLYTVSSDTSPTLREASLFAWTIAAASAALVSRENAIVAPVPCLSPTPSVEVRLLGRGIEPGSVLGTTTSDPSSNGRQGSPSSAFVSGRHKRGGSSAKFARWISQKTTVLKSETVCTRLDPAATSFEPRLLRKDRENPDSA